jgi:hypothetical protein
VKFFVCFFIYWGVLEKNSQNKGEGQNGKMARWRGGKMASGLIVPCPLAFLRVISVIVKFFHWSKRVGKIRLKKSLRNLRSSGKIFLVTNEDFFNRLSHSIATLLSLIIE